MYIKNNVLDLKLGVTFVFLAIFGLNGCSEKVEETVIETPAQEDVPMSAAPADNHSPSIVADDLTAADSETDLQDDVVVTDTVSDSIVTDNIVTEPADLINETESSAN